MNHFCTLFDSNFFSRGLAMYRSLAAVHDYFTLYVFCFDDRVHRLLSEMHLPGVVPISLGEFETQELLAVKASRSKAEYCWTCTPHVIRHVLDNYRILQVTYLDADLFFFASPSLLLQEFEQSGGSVLITGHRFAARYMKAVVHGIYCVQFMTFKNDERGMEVLSWWQERCLEWCYARVEEGKFGDQKYLDDWPERFEGIHILQHEGGGLAPWNIIDYKLSREQNGLIASNVNRGALCRAVFYHFHNLRFNNGGYLDLGYYMLTADARGLLYKPYLKSLFEAGKILGKLDGSFDPHGFSAPQPGWREFLGRIRRRLNGNYYAYSCIKEREHGTSD
ncbi:MAG TPA: hypothetical protein VGJ93_09570 [Desulfuromonadaceae bacterium]|jgi:hypothetical protein